MRRPTYTPASYIKKAFRPGERSLPRSEIIDRLEQDVSAIDPIAGCEAILEEVLQMSPSPIQAGRTEAIVELTYKPHQVFDLAYRYLRESHTAKTIEQIIPEIRKKTQLSWNQVVRLLELERDMRFIQYIEDKRWYLAEWKVVNDQVYAYAQNHDIALLSLRGLTHFLETIMGLPSKEYAFLPHLDDRFAIDGDTVRVQVGRDGEPVVEASSIAAIEEGAVAAPAPVFVAEEVAASVMTHTNEVQINIEEESEMNMNGTQGQPVLREVDELLKQAVQRLEARNKQMGQEVVDNFQQSNLQAIEELMQEKMRNEEIVMGIEQVLATIEQQ